MDLIILTLLLVFVITCIVIFQYIVFNLRYFKKQGIPGPTPIPFFGTLWHVWGKNAHEVLLEEYKKYGKLYGTHIGSLPCLNIADPKLIKAVFRDDYQHFSAREERTINSRKPSRNYDLALLPGGLKWKTIRRLLSASVAPTHVKQNIPLLNEVAQKLVTRLTHLSEAGDGVDIQIECQCWSLEMMSKLLFSLNVDVIGNPSHEFTINAGREVRGHIEGIFSTIAYLKPDSANFIQRLWKPKILGQEYFAEIGEKLFQERDKINIGKVQLNNKISNTEDSTTTKRTDIDMLDNLMINLKTKLLTNSTNMSLEEDRIKLSVAQLAASHISFHDIGSSVSRALHCLAMNPEIQKKARLEVMDGLLDNGVITFNLIQKLPYLEQCINESMRLYPINYRITRAVNKDKHYDNVFFKAGTLVRVPSFGLNKDAEYYPNPEKFDPERFSRAELSKRDPYIFLPFGDGPRDCPARRMVITIMKFCMCHMLQNFKLYPVQETIDPLQCTSGFPGSMTVIDEMWLGIERIKTQ